MDTPYEHTPGGRLRAARKAAGLTIVEAAKAIGVTYATLGDLERNRDDHAPKPETLRKIAHAYGCPVSVLESGLRDDGPRIVLVPVPGGKPGRWVAGPGTTDSTALTRILGRPDVTSGRLDLLIRTATEEEGIAVEFPAVPVPEFRPSGGGAKAKKSEE